MATTTRSKTRAQSQAAPRSSKGASEDKTAESNVANISSAEKDDYRLDPQEFGPLGSPEHMYTQHHEPMLELPPEEEDLPRYPIFIITYLMYLILIIIGHIRDFMAKLVNDKSAQELKQRNGYAPLFSDFDSFYTRRLKHRLADCFARQTTGVPGRFIKIFDRISNDFYYTYHYPGTIRSCLNLSSYNYLGFAQSVGQCTDAAEHILKSYGISAGGTPACGGASDLMLETEQVVADFVGKERAALYSMGYGTNANIFSCLVDRNCLVISDELNHASIRFGVRMSGAVIKIFKHNDMEALEKLLREQISQGQPRTHRPWKKIMVVVEGLYSMEGTMCNLPRLIVLRRQYKFYLFVDEAHSIGAIGARGRGVCDYFSADPNNVDVLMGTLTKSFGATGGYVAADKAIIDYIKVRNIGNLRSEAMSPAVLAQIQSSLKTITGEIRPGEGDERLKRLAFNSRYLRLGLHRMGFNVAGIADSPIVPVMLYKPTYMPALSRELLDRNIAVVVVGYPATPLTSSRVRLCVSAALTKEDLDQVLEAFYDLGTEMGFNFSQCKDESGKLLRQSYEEVVPHLVADVQKEWSEVF